MVQGVRFPHSLLGDFPTMAEIETKEARLSDETEVVEYRTPSTTNTPTRHIRFIRTSDCELTFEEIFVPQRQSVEDSPRVAGDVVEELIREDYCKRVVGPDGNVVGQLTIDEI